MVEHDDIFDTAFERTMEFEGVYSHDDQDEGGPTIYGISAVHYPEVVSEIMALPKKKRRPRAKRFFYEEFWKTLGVQGITNAQIAIRVFDAAVNPGPSAAVKLLQSVLNILRQNSLQVDGILGPRTKKAVNEYSRPDILLKAFMAHRIMYYYDRVEKKPFKRKYLDGWIRRA